ncbi:p450 domain containing protein, partial [Asbolus verrucosus]
IEKFFKNFPTPPTVPFFGNAREFASTTAILKTLHKYRKQYGGLIHAKMGPIQHVLICSDHKFLEFLLSSNKILKKSPNLKYLEPWIGDGLITADAKSNLILGGPKWKTHRRLITPAFHFKILEQFVDIFEADGNILVEKLSKRSGSKSLDIYPYITLNCQGTKVNVQNNDTSSYFESVKYKNIQHPRDVCAYTLQLLFWFHQRLQNSREINVKNIA